MKTLQLLAEKSGTIPPPTSWHYRPGGSAWTAGIAKSPRSVKTDLIETALRAFPREFTIAELEEACFKVSHDMVCKVLREAGAVECLGCGSSA